MIDPELLDDKIAQSRFPIADAINAWFRQLAEVD